jgi:prepilin-type processing-associated H-X9-DG protein
MSFYCPFAIAAVVTSALLAVAGEDKPLTPTEARNKVGHNITVEMIVKATKDRLEKRGEIYLDAEPDFRDVKNSVRGRIQTSSARARRPAALAAGLHQQRVQAQGVVWVGKGGSGWFHFTQGGMASGNPYAYDHAKRGGVFGINWGATLVEVNQQDGTSHTIMLNEIRVGVEARDRRGTWAMGAAGSSVTAANGTVGDSPTPNDRNPLSDDVEDCQLYWSPALGPRDGMGCSNENAPHNWPNFQAQARSRHLGGVNTCFADGSVRFIRNSVSSAVWDLMLSRNDGQVYDYDF